MFPTVRFDHRTDAQNVSHHTMRMAEASIWPRNPKWLPSFPKVGESTALYADKISSRQAFSDVALCQPYMHGVQTYCAAVGAVTCGIISAAIVVGAHPPLAGILAGIVGGLLLSAAVAWISGRTIENTAMTRSDLLEGARMMRECEHFNDAHDAMGLWNNIVRQSRRAPLYASQLGAAVTEFVAEFNHRYGDPEAE